MEVRLPGSGFCPECQVFALLEGTDQPVPASGCRFISESELVLDIDPAEGTYLPVGEHVFQLVVRCGASVSDPVEFRVLVVAPVEQQGAASEDQCDV